MRKILLSLITFSLSCLTSVSVFTQDRQQIATTHREVAIIIQQQSIRFSAPQGTQELRLEIFNHTGELIYDSGMVNGSELSWPLQNAQGEPVASGLYAYILKVKEANAEYSHAQGGHLIVDRRQDRDPQTDRLWVTSQGAGGAGATITAADLTVASSKDETVAGARVSPKAPNAPPLPKVSGSGTPGQIAKWTDIDTIGDSIISESGSGNVGIGTTTPTQKLQVAGVIHSTTGGIKFPDGTVQTTASVGGVTSVTASGPLASSGGAIPNISLTGVVPIANGGTGSSTQNFVDLTTGQTIGGTKTFSSNIVGNITGNAATVTNGVYTTGDQIIGGNKTFTNAVNTNSQYNINGNRVLANPGLDNLFAGVGAGSNNTGVFNSFFGTRAGSANTEGSGNSFFGREAGRSNTTGGENSFFGEQAGFSNTTGGQNSFFGSKAGSSNTVGINNSFFGVGAGHSTTTGNNNSFFGGFAGNANTSGRHNSFFGFLAGSGNTTGEENSFFGSGAGEQNITGSRNSFIGTGAGPLNTTGGGNSFIGSSAGNRNTTGASNTFIGDSAGLSNTTENNNTFIGANANGAAGITNASAIGANALVTSSGSLVLGNSGVKVGIGVTAPTERLQVAGVIHSTTGGIRFPDGSIQTSASAGGGVTNVTASGPLTSSGGAIPNISLTGVIPIANGGTGSSTQNFVDLTTWQTIDGTKTFSNPITGNITGNAATVTNGVYTTGDQTIDGNKTFANAVNTNSQYNIKGNRVLANPGLGNTFVGMGSGPTTPQGAMNSFFGANTGNSTTGSENAFFGYEAGKANTTGYYNSFFGAYTGHSNTTALYNSFFGNQAGLNNTSGEGNAFFGAAAGALNTTGGGNSFFGRVAGLQNTTGQLNSFFGISAGENNVTGSNNTIVGFQAGYSNINESNNTFMGYRAQGVGGVTNATAIGANALVTASNSLVLGDDSVKVGIGVTAPTEKLQVAGVIHSTTGGIRFPDGSIQTTAMDVRSGDVYIGTAGQGVILKSPDGATCRKLTIDNSGALVLTAIPCP